MSEQPDTDILRDIATTIKSMRRYMAVLTFFVLLVTIMPFVDRVLAARQEEQEADIGSASPVDGGDTGPFVLELGWTNGKQIDAFTDNLEFYTARSPENEQGTYVSLYCSPRFPDIDASIWFADTPMFSDRFAEYQHLRAKPGFLGFNTLMISTHNLRAYKVSPSRLEAFLSVEDSLVVEINRDLGITETIYFIGIDAAITYLMNSCQ